MVLARDCTMGFTKFTSTEQADAVMITRSQTVTGVRSIRAWAGPVSFKLICSHLSGAGCPWIYEGQVEACVEVE